MNVSFKVSSIAIGMVFLYGCVGEIIIEKAGPLNLGLPGVMCMGTAGGCTGVYLYMGLLSENAAPSYILLLLFALVFCFIFAGFAGLIYAFFTVSLRCNQNITGLALTTFGTGFTQFVMDSLDRTSFSDAATVLSKGLPFASALGDFGSIFLSHGILVYLAIGLAIATSIILKRTKVGLYLRAIGENPATADAAGINVTAYKYVAILVGCMVAGLGGFFYIMDFLKGSWENASAIEAFGWLSIALVIFTVWKPDLSIIGSIVFGALYLTSISVSGISFSQMKILKIIPYAITVLVLIGTSIFGGKNVQAPASLGLNYFREER